MEYDLTKAQLRMTAAEFASQNPTPENKQLCVPWDRGWTKVGDGSTAFNDLPKMPPAAFGVQERRSALDIYRSMQLSDGRDEEGGGSGPLYYVADIWQDGTGAPAVNSESNSSGASVVYSYEDIGTFKATFSPNVFDGKLVVAYFINSPNNLGAEADIAEVSVNTSTGVVTFTTRREDRTDNSTTFMNSILGTGINVLKVEIYEPAA
jgi:hypothetical protein